MKILWIVNTPLGPIGEKVYGNRVNGIWMDALLKSFQGIRHDISIATVVNTKEIIRLSENGVDYFALPDQVPLLYDEKKPGNIQAWRKLLAEIQPDLIQVFGTEFSHGLCALREAHGIPSVIYMQGYLGSIVRHYLAGMTANELKRNITFRDIIKRDSIRQQQKKFMRAAEKEKEMFQLSGRIISENEWCNASVRAVFPGIKAYSCPLSVNPVFSQTVWRMDQCEPHSLICNASGYPLKGLHMLLRAVALLKKKFPDIKLYIPGAKVVSDGSLQWALRKRGYTKYIESLIAELGIEENIVWLGSLNQENLAQAYTKARVFVLCSAIENHSSSLKEAMMVGVPCVASAVGGIPEYVRHGENGFLYRFEEYEIMASYIGRLFEDSNLTVRLSKNAREDTNKRHSRKTIQQRMLEIYREILSEERKV